MYYVLTGETLPKQNDVEFEEPDSYCAGIQSAIIGKQNAVTKYRQILYALTDRVLINGLTDIITDEIRHGILYNYLYSKANARAKKFSWGCWKIPAVAITKKLMIRWRYSPPNFLLSLFAIG